MNSPPRRSAESIRALDEELDQQGFSHREHQSSWKLFLEGLRKRGLHAVLFVVSDELLLCLSSPIEPVA